MDTVEVVAWQQAADPVERGAPEGSHDPHHERQRQMLLEVGDVVVLAVEVAEVVRSVAGRLTRLVQTYDDQSDAGHGGGGEQHKS